MLFFTIFTSLAWMVHSGLISHDVGGDNHYEKATSYQNIHMEHFHAVPTYIKKEYTHLLEHPVSVGKSSSNLKIHHGDKHDHGYAIADSHNTAQGSASGDEHYGSHEASNLLAGHESASLSHESSNVIQKSADLGHESVSAGAGSISHNTVEGYQVQDQSQDVLQHQLIQQIPVGYAHAATPTGQAQANLGHYQILQEGNQHFDAAYAQALQYQNAGMQETGHAR